MIEEESERVAILLATYNGERHLDEQLSSLLAQTYRDFVVIARDDRSSDRTLDILAKWSVAHPEKMHVVSDDFGNLRPLGNFSRLLEVCNTSYFAFCDQDDIWLPNKIETMMKEIQQIENLLGKTVPIMIHSDLKIVDENLREIASSLFDHWKINRTHDQRIERLIINNIVAGCASIGNRALIELARPIPPGIFAHDWWLALIAASCGVLRTIPEATILYRQHDRNQVGAGPPHGRSTLWDARYILQQPQKLTARLAKAMEGAQSRASILLRVAGDRMSQHDREFLRAFCLPKCRAEAAGLPWRRRAWLGARFLTVYTRALPLALRWCY